MALAENNSQGGYFRDLTLDFNGDDYSNPSASSYASTAYKTGGLYNTSGRQNTGLGLGKIILYSGLAFAAYWLYKKMNRK